MTGRQLQKAAVEMCNQRGYMVAHFTAAMVRPGVFVTPMKAQGKGFPDLIVAGHGKMFAIEVKGSGDSLRPEQRMWLALFEEAGIPTLVLTVAAWRKGALEALLDA